MAIIYTYPSGAVKADDLILVSEQDSVGVPTKNITVSDLANFVTSTGEGTGTTDYIVKWVDGPNGLIGDSPMFTFDGGAGLKQAILSDGYRFVVDRDATTTVGDPEYAITQNGVNKTSFGWDDDGGGFGFLYNWAGKGFKFGSTTLYPQFEILTDPDVKNITFADFEFDADIIDITGSVGNAGEVLSSLGAGNGVQWVVNGSGTVTGTGTTDKVTKWVDGPNGVLGDSSITDTGLVGGVEVEPAPGIKWTFAPGSTFSFNNGGAPSNTFEFKTANDGFYNPNFRFTGTLAVDRTSQATGASLDVGVSANPIPAAWFRNGVVVSNNPSGVQVDNTSVVIGAGNNDIVSGSDNCLAVGNNNQILADSDHSLAVGQGNTMSNADNSIVVGQQNTLTGNRLYSLGFSNDLTCASAFALGGENAVGGTQNNFAIGYNNNLQGSQKNFIFGTSNSCGTGGSSYQQSIILGNNCTLGVASSGTATEFGMVVIGSNNAENYPGTTSGQPFRPKIVLAADVGGGQKDALVISEGVNGIASMLHSDALLEHNFANDAAAAAGGVPVGALYHNAGEVRIRIV